MVVLTNPALEHISLVDMHKPTNTNTNTNHCFCGIPVIDLSKPEAKTMLVRACEELGFFKVVNHGISVEVMATLEAEAIKFFSMTQVEKEKVGLANPYGYGSKMIGPNGDVGWLEYLLIQTTSKPTSSLAFLSGITSAEKLRWALGNYLAAVRKLTCEVLEMMAEGLGIGRRDVFSRLVMDEESDTIFRLNHYPPHPLLKGKNRRSITGFGEHTDPQIISLLRSNNTSGLQISLRDGSWISVPSDQASFFINVGDALQVMTNGRFRSVKHRVMANGLNSRVSMIYFGGPPCRQRIAPLQVLMKEGEESHYREFTWFEYKTSAYKTKLADNRLALFEKKN